MEEKNLTLWTLAYDQDKPNGFKVQAVLEEGENITIEIKTIQNHIKDK